MPWHRTCRFTGTQGHTGSNRWLDSVSMQTIQIVGRYRQDAGAANACVGVKLTCDEVALTVKCLLGCLRLPPVVAEQLLTLHMQLPNPCTPVTL